MKQLLHNCYGIIMRRQESSKHKLVIFDRRLGMIEVIFASSTIGAEVMSGALARYDLQQKNNVYFMCTFELIDLSLALAQSDLLFVHHVLELCFYFVPVGSLNYTLFELLMLLYAINASLWTMQAKKIFLFKLMTIIGLDEEHPLLEKPSIILLLNISIDKIHTQSIDLECEKDIMDWLSVSVFAHPNIDRFKTTSFLSKNRVGRHEKNNC